MAEKQQITKNNKPKIALIGGGNIGGTIAHIASIMELGEIVILDRTGDIAKGKALDIAQSAVVHNTDTFIIGTESYEEIAGASVAIITAGSARKPGMSRDDLVKINTSTIREVAINVRKYAPSAFVIIVTNPLDAMVYAFQKYSEFEPKMVVGMAGELDSARFKLFLGQALKISIADIKTVVMGGHGDTMIPLINYTTVAGIPLTQLIEQKYISHSELDSIIHRTRNGGAEIVNLLQTGSAYYAPATAAISMAKTYLRNERRLMTCATQLNGEYGINGLYIGVPAIIGANGVEKIIELELNSKEKEMLDHSVSSVKSLVEIVNNIKF